MDRLQSLSLFGEAEVCHDASPMSEADCPAHGQKEYPLSKEDKKNCCENGSFELDGQDLDITVPQLSIELTIPVVLTTFFDVVQRPEKTELADDFPVDNHSPPDGPELLSLIQVFRL